MIYAVTSDLGYIKIGITGQDIKRRVLELQTGHPKKKRISPSVYILKRKVQHKESK